MTLRFHVLGVELWTLTLEHETPAAAESDKKRPGLLSKARKTTAMVMIR